MNIILSSVSSIARRRTGGGAPPAGLLVDDLTGVTNAYSVARKLRAAYGGSAIRVRESGGNTEADIGFTGDELNTTALLAHCGANSGYIVMIYDQVGSTPWVQATSGEQPLIVNAGAVVVDGNGKPRIEFDGTDDNVTGGPDFVVPGTDLTVAMIIAELDRDLWGYSQYHGINGWHSVLPSRMRDGVQSSHYVGTAGTGAAPFLWYYSADGTTCEASINNSSIAGVSEGTTTTRSGAMIGGDGLGSTGTARMYFQERLRFNSDAIAQKATWEANINTFYQLW